MEMHSARKNPQEGLIPERVGRVLPELAELNGILFLWWRSLLVELDRVSKDVNLGRFSNATIEDFQVIHERALEASGLAVDRTLLAALQLITAHDQNAFGVEVSGLIPVSRGGSEESESHLLDEVDLENLPEMDFDIIDNSNRKKASIAFVRAIEIRVIKMEREALARETAAQLLALMTSAQK